VPGISELAPFRERKAARRLAFEALAKEVGQLAARIEMRHAYAGEKRLAAPVWLPALGEARAELERREGVAAAMAKRAARQAAVAARAAEIGLFAARAEVRRLAKAEAETKRLADRAARQAAAQSAKKRPKRPGANA